MTTLIQINNKITDKYIKKGILQRKDVKPSLTSIKFILFTHPFLIRS